MIEGHATIRGTDKFCEKFPGLYRQTPYWISSAIGLGTHLGDMNTVDSQLYRDSLEYALMNGINIIDTAINYRGMLSERDIGFVLNKLMNEEGLLQRNEVIISTKADIIPGDIEAQLVPAEYLKKILLSQNIIRESDLNIVGYQRHVMNPKYYEFAIRESRKHLKIETIDIHYIHNPELSMKVLGEDSFYERLANLFAFYEETVLKGFIRYYGMAVWEEFLLNPDQSGYISLEKVMKIATHVGGEDHHFRFIQVPYNLVMNKAGCYKNQSIGKVLLSCFDAAKMLGLSITTSAPFGSSNAIKFGGNLQKLLTSFMKEKKIMSVMIGMKNKEHVKDNLETMAVLRQGMNYK